MQRVRLYQLSRGIPGGRIVSESTAATETNVSAEFAAAMLARGTAAEALVQVGCKGDIIELFRSYMEPRLKVNLETGTCQVLDEKGGVRYGVSAHHFANELRAKYGEKYFNTK